MKLELNKVYSVCCIKLLATGAVFELSDKTTEFIHMSQLSEHSIRRPEDAVNVGVTYTAICIYSERAKKIELSLKVNDSMHMQTRGEFDSLDAFYRESGDPVEILPHSKTKRRKKKNRYSTHKKKSKGAKNNVPI